MAQSFSTDDRSKYHRESPLFWLYLIAASLTMHLVILLIGRWYLTQPSHLQAAGSSTASVEFVEIDPNASGSQPPKSVSPSATQNAPLPQVASPPANNSSEDSQSSLNAPILENSTPRIIPNVPRPSVSPSSSPSPSQTNLPQQKNQTIPPQSMPPQDRQQPVEPAGAGKQRTSSPPPSSPGSASPTPQSSPAYPSGTPSASPSPDSSSQLPGKVNSGSSSSSGSNPSDAKDNAPPAGTQNTGTSSAPSRSDTSLEGYSNLGVQLTSKLEIPAAARNQTSAKAAKLISPIDINLAYPVKLPTRVLDLRISLVIDNESGSVLDLKVLEDSPTLRAYPEIDKGLIEGAVAQAFYQAKFQVDVETNQGNKAPASDWETSIRVQLSP
jgi:hypothetical protein